MSIATTNSTPSPGPKTPTRTPAKVLTKTPTKTPAKTTSKAPAKTPAKAAPKTPSKPLSKTLAKTSISTLWSSQFTNNKKKRKRVDDFSSEQHSDIHELSDIDGGLGILRYVKSRAKIKPDPVKIEEGTKLEKKNTLAFYDTTDREEDESEDNHAVFKQYLLNGKSNSTKATPVSAPEAVSSSPKANTTMTKKKVPIKQEGRNGGVIGEMAASIPRLKWIIQSKSTTSRRAPIPASKTVNTPDSQS